MFYKSNIVNAFPIHSSAESKVGAVGSTPPPGPTGVDLYSRFAFAGAVCCSVTHGALTPVDVVKTRIQLEPEVYNKVCLPPCRHFQFCSSCRPASKCRKRASQTRLGFRRAAKFSLGVQTLALTLQTSSHVVLNTPADAVPSVSSREWCLPSARLFGMMVLVHF